MDVESIITVGSVAAVVCVSVYAAVKQRHPRAITFGVRRFRKAGVLIGFGIVFGAFDPPNNRTALVLFAGSVAMSVIVGLARGRYSAVWLGVDDRTVMNRGTRLSIGLFVGLILAKCALSGYGQTRGVNDAGALGEILFMIGVMAGVYAEVVAGRGQAVLASRGSAVSAPASPTE